MNCWHGAQGAVGSVEAWKVLLELDQNKKHAQDPFYPAGDASGSAVPFVGPSRLRQEGWQPCAQARWRETSEPTVFNLSLQLPGSSCRITAPAREKERVASVRGGCQVRWMG